MFETIPKELRDIPQWCVAGPNGEPINPRTGKMAKVNSPATWGTFEEATRNGSLPGFILTKNDPYVVIDLDDKDYNPCPADEKAVHIKIVQTFCSYTEISRSGRGYHIILRGTMPTGGTKRGRVECYSAGRFMIFTGQGNSLPIVEKQELLDQLISEMTPTIKAEAFQLSEKEEVLTDDELFDMALNAADGAKFDRLTRGEWAEYSTQSEADLALLSILAFYSQSNSQVRRIFRLSPLGQREKATKDNRYLDTNLRRIRSQEAPMVDFSSLKIPEQPKIPEKSAKKAPKTAPSISPIPPGFTGELTNYFLSVSIRPVPEIAATAAIGFLSGVLGRAYNVSGTGLNQYILLLAKTGVGKEGIQNAIDRLLEGVRLTVPIVDDYIGPAAYASGPAIIKTLAKYPCIVSILGEFGLILQSLSDPKNATGLMSKKVLLDMYGKSGAGKVLRPSVYSNSDKSTDSINSPSLTIVGESTPETFYEGLTQSHISEGLIPRFLILHYTGPRPPINNQLNTGEIPEAIKTRIVELVAAASSLQNSYQTINVKISDAAQKLLDAFNLEADDAINSARQDVEAQLWNRVHLKALKLAAMLAVADNPHEPEINELSALWAINLIRKDLNTMIEKFTSGDIGHGDAKQLADLRRALTTYFTTDEKTLIESYALPSGLKAKGLIPYLFLQRRTANLASYRQDHNGSTIALKRAIESLISSGELMELPRSQCQGLGYTGRIFGIPG